MRKATIHTGVMSSGHTTWNARHVGTINRNKGLDLLPKNMHDGFLKRFKEWWTK